MVPPSRKSCYNFRVTEINRVVDGDTIDVTIDLGFDLYKKERVRVAGVDTPEKRTRDLEEKALGLDATNWMKKNLEDAIDGDDELTIRTELKGEIDIYNPHHWHSIQMMFQRNMRKGQIEKTATKPGDAINNALDDFWEAQDGSDGSTEQEKLL